MDTYTHTPAFDPQAIEAQKRNEELITVKLERNYYMEQANRWRKRAFRALLIPLIVALCLVATSVDAREYTHDAELIRIVDGDTYVMRLHIYHGSHTVQHVRLADWDTPEYRGKCQREKDLALQAAIFAGLWFEGAGPVRATSRQQDSFGRPLSGLVGVNGSLGLALRDAGLARPFKRGRNEGWCDE